MSTRCPSFCTPGSPCRWLPLLLVLTGLVPLPGGVRAGTVNPARWRWSNPLPHGNNVFDMLMDGDVAVQVGDGGSVYVQFDGGRWAPAVTGVTNYLRGVTLLGARIIAVGEEGCILWSDDGKTFQRAQLSPVTSDWFEGVTASTQRAVAVGDNGAIYTSTDGVAWSKATSGTTEWLRGVAAGSGSFVAVGENGMVLRSTTGTSWSRVTIGVSAHLNRVRYLGSGAAGQYIAVGNGGVALSSANGSSSWSSLGSGTTNHLYDAALNDTGTLLVGDQEIRFRATGITTWSNQITSLSTNAPPGWVYLSAVGAGNSYWVAGRTGLLLEGTRTNGVSQYAWQALPDSSHAWLWDVTVVNGTYVAAGDLATILTSLDGILWSREVVPVPRTNTVLLGVGGTTNLLLAAGNAGIVLISRAGLTNLAITNVVGTNLVVTSNTFNTLGLIWTNLPVFTTNTLQGVAASDNRYVLSGEWGMIFTSTDGSNWTTHTTPTTNFLSGITPFPNGWLAVGDRGTMLRAGPDAADWTRVTLNTTNWLYRARWTGSQMVVVGQNGAIFTSPDGTNWTARVSGTKNRLNDVTFVDGTWFAVGNQGLLLASTNLAAWTALPAPTVKSLFGAATFAGQLVLTGVEGVVLRNQVVPQSTPVNILGYDLSLVTETNGVTAYELFLFGGEPDQFFAFQSCTNLGAGSWATNASLELFDASGTMYLLRSRDQTNVPLREFYRTALTP